MKISDIIVILLFIVPGAIADKVYCSMDMPSGEKKSEFRELLNGILMSLPIIIIVSFVMCLIYRINNVQDFTKNFNDVYFLVAFSGNSIAIALIIGFLRGFFADRINTCINWIRGVKKRIPIDDKSCWRRMFLDDPSSHYVEIIRDGKPYAGFTKWYSLPNEEKEIVIYLPDFLKSYPEYESKFNTVNQTYINIEKNIVIRDYDMNEYNEWIDSLYKLNEDVKA